MYFIDCSKTEYLAKLTKNKNKLLEQIKVIDQQIDSIDSMEVITNIQRSTPFYKLPLSLMNAIYNDNENIYNWFTRKDEITGKEPNINKSIEDYEKCGNPCGKLQFLESD